MKRQNLISTDLIEYVDCDTYSIVYEEFDYPVVIQKCSSSLILSPFILSSIETNLSKILYG
jgi:hypothetical protein